MDLGKLQEWLKGKKTYIVALCTILGAVIAWVTATAQGTAPDTANTVQIIITAILGMTIRSGVTTAQNETRAMISRALNMGQPPQQPK